MKKAFLTFATILILLALGLIVLYFIRMPHPLDTTPLPDENDGTTNPFPGTTTSGQGENGTGTSTTVTAPEGKQYIFGKNGQNILVNDFKKDRVPKQSQYVGNYFYLAPEATSFDYEITYTEKDQFFQITIENEPLGGVRTAAETRLLSVLGISAETACNLKHSVNIPRSVSEMYSGRNVEFSFCPGAIALPEI